MKKKKEVVPPQIPATLSKIENVKIEITPIEFKNAKEMRKAFDQTHAEVKQAGVTAEHLRQFPELVGAFRARQGTGRHPRSPRSVNR